MIDNTCRNRVLLLMVLALSACGGGSQEQATQATEATAGSAAESTTEETSEDAEAEAATVPIPDTEIWLVDLEWRRGFPSVGVVANITERPGYDNQPAFLPDGSGLLYSSIRDDGQADIWRYDIDTGLHRQVTDTAEPEYSPTPIRGGFSTVRVEQDGSQLLWRYDMAGEPQAVLLPETPKVGYHAWLDEDSLGLFLVGELGERMSLHLADLPETATRQVALDIGRALHRVPNTGELSFVDLSAGEEGPWVIRAMEPETGAVRTVAETLPGSQDLVWEPSGGLFQGQDETLYYLPPGATEWRVVADLSEVLGAPISRLAVSGDRSRLALVTVSE